MGQGPLFWDVVGFSVKFVFFLFAFFLVVLTWDLFHIIELCLPSFSEVIDLNLGDGLKTFKTVDNSANT